MNRRRCNHRTCDTLANLRFPSRFGTKIGCSGVGVAMFNRYDSHIPGRKLVPVALLGLERGGAYQGKYNFCAGKMEDQDEGCYIKGFCRELREEFKIELSPSEFRRIFCDSNGHMRFYTAGRTAMFVGLAIGLSRRPLKAAVTDACNNPALPWCEKEMADVDWFRVSDHQQLEGRNMQVSSFVSSQLSNAYRCLTENP